ncbi:unnamed protein product [Chrysoparadoxa australica]
MGPLWLGLDLSTQSLSVAVLSNESMTPLSISSINFQDHLPHYATSNGMHIDGDAVTSPVRMWLDAVDIALMKLKETEKGGSQAPTHLGGCYPALKYYPYFFLSVSGQQHGTVYWAAGAEEKLKGLASKGPRTTLNEALWPCWARLDCPIWADSSTVAQCHALEEAMGGAAHVAKATGSSAYPRFSGNQICRLSVEEPEMFAGCERISLVSSFVTSLLIGKYASIDTSDGSGMNLMDLNEKKWHAQAVKACSGNGDAPALLQRLGPLSDPTEIAGELSAFFHSKYGLPVGCPVVVGTGDNPSSLAATIAFTSSPESTAGIHAVLVTANLLPFQCAMLARTFPHHNSCTTQVSLGTSDTIIGLTGLPVPQPVGHIMVNPVDPDQYFAMLVYKNGSLIRKRLRDLYCEGSWDKFELCLKSTQPGNGGKLGLFLDLAEITPQLERTGDYFCNADGEALEESSLTGSEKVRALVEGRFLSMRARLQQMGIPPPSRLIAVGGGSASRGILQVLADVFGADVYTFAVPDAAAVGAALRAKHGVLSHQAGKPLPYSNVLLGVDCSENTPKLAVTANKQHQATYEGLLGPYHSLEEGLKA